MSVQFSAGVNMLKTIERTEHTSAKPKSDRLNLRVTTTDRVLLERAAQLEGLSTSSFLIRAAAESAREVIARQQRITVPAEAFDRLISALEAPAEVNPKMLERLRRTRERQA